MSHRRFMVLVRGLGPNSATVTSLQAGRYFGEQRIRETSSPDESERAMGRFFGGVH